MGALLEVSQLTKCYKNGRGIRELSFALQKGDIFGLLGPNGSGKTTTMKLLLGLLAPQGGQVKLGEDTLEENREKVLERVGALIETPALYSYLTAYQNLKLAARYYEGIYEPRIEDLLNQVGLSGYKYDKVKDFSLGMKQRLGLALAFLGVPQLVVLDEPTNGMDITGMVDIREMILRENQKAGTTILISSHLAHELEQICNKIGIMKEGKLIKVVALEEALRKSGSLEHYYLDCTRKEEERT